MSGPAFTPLQSARLASIDAEEEFRVADIRLRYSRDRVGVLSEFEHEADGDLSREFKQACDAAAAAMLAVMG